MININEYINQLSNKLINLYNLSEARTIADLYLSEILNLSKNEKFLKKYDILSDSDINKLDKGINRLLKGEPLQYVLQTSWFYGLKFKVNKDVLIPRQETEILVDKIIKDNKASTNINILDIGTGSGCIPISIKTQLPHANIFSVDISPKALIVAKQNSEYHNTEINFAQYDILSSDNFPFSIKFDLIISNPPYVLESEKKLMHKNILNYEPDQALYVTDKDPLVFYKKILDFAKTKLTKNGMIMLEINEKYANQMTKLCTNKDFNNTLVIKDLNNKDRFIAAKLNI